MLGYYRLLAAVGVLITHAGGGTDGMLRAMVSAFFIVSGYLMVLTLQSNYQRNPLPFYWNQFLHIYQMYSVVAITVFVLAPCFVALRMASLPAADHLGAFARSRWRSPTTSPPGRRWGHALPWAISWRAW